MDVNWSVVGGLLCGAMAGAGARYGRVCSMSAIEDALVAGDYRGAKAWALAAGAAGLATTALVALGLVELDAATAVAPRIHLLGSALGGLMFGLGMTLVGTCSFGLVVRAGGGDLRALVSGLVIGVLAFASTAGLLAPVRNLLLVVGHLDAAPLRQATFAELLSHWAGKPAATAAAIALFAILAAIPLLDRRLRQRPRLLAGAVLIGLAVAAGWLVTSISLDEFTGRRVESLSFVAPAGRALLQLMAVPFREESFGMMALIGVAAASFVVAAARRELRWEAFDDALEMRRHMAGAALMGIGGVLAHGCTIGQGISATSVLAFTAPVFLFTLLVGAKLGLRLLIEGTALWRLGFSPRAD